MLFDQLQSYWHRFLNNDDDEAFSLLYSHYVNQLYAYGLGLGFDSGVCEDAVQDVFFKFYSHKRQLTHIENLQFYLFRSMRNRLLDIQKQRDAFQSLDLQEVPFTTEITVLDNLVDEEESEFLKKRVESLLSSLTARQREAIYLRYMQNMEYDEIAEIFKMAPQSVRQLVHRGLTSIRKTTSTSHTGTYTAIFILFSVSNV